MRFTIAIKHRLSAWLPALLLACTTTAAIAKPVTYEIDPDHTFPSFEADHMNGLSVWRGKFDRSSGTITLDREAGAGSVDVKIDTSSVDFGLERMNEKARSDEIFDATRFPQAAYKGKLAAFVDGAPTKVVGALTLHGVTRPLDLKIESFKCMKHPMKKGEVCGADALATFDRSEFGIDAGKRFGFRMDVTLRIQVEATEAPVAK